MSSKLRAFRCLLLLQTCPGFSRDGQGLGSFAKNLVRFSHVGHVFQAAVRIPLVSTDTTFQNEGFYRKTSEGEWEASRMRKGAPEWLRRLSVNS